VREDGRLLRGEAVLMSFLDVPGTSHLRTSVLVAWADSPAVSQGRKRVYSAAPACRAARDCLMRASSRAR